MILEDAKNYSITNLKDDDTDAILCVGAWGRNQGSDPRDIDVILIKSNQLTSIDHHEYVEAEFSVEVWIHDKEAMINEITTLPTTINAITSLSQILAFLRDTTVWFEKEPFVSTLIEKAKTWQWDPSLSTVFEFPVVSITEPWAQKAYDESIALLQAAKQRLSSGLPISHRRKDYPEISSTSTKDHALTVFQAMEKAYAELAVGYKWPEYSDAEKAIQTEKWADVVDSVKDVLRYMVRYALPSVPEQLMDPTLWKSAEEMSISPTMLDALKAAFS